MPVLPPLPRFRLPVPPTLNPASLKNVNEPPFWVIVDIPEWLPPWPKPMLALFWRLTLPESKVNRLVVASKTPISIRPPPEVLMLMVPPLLVTVVTLAALPAKPRLNHWREFSVPPLMTPVLEMAAALLPPLPKATTLAVTVPPVMLSWPLPPLPKKLPPTCISPETSTVPAAALMTPVDAPLEPTKMPPA